MKTQALWVEARKTGARYSCRRGRAVMGWESEGFAACMLAFLQWEAWLVGN